MTTSTNTLGQQYLKYYINLQIILFQIKNNQRINICLVRMLKSYKKLVLYKNLQWCTCIFCYKLFTEIFYRSHFTIFEK